MQRVHRHALDGPGGSDERLPCDLAAEGALAVLVGALTVGDSVRISLRQKALNRLAGFDIAVNAVTPAAAKTAKKEKTTA